MIRVDVPRWAEWLDVPRALDRQFVRHRVLVGGRAGGKSWTIAHKLVERAWRGQERILCTREIQNSIRDSSKRLIEDWIDRLGLGPRGNGFFTITEKEIRGQNGSTFSFMGLNGKDNAIKSLEGYTLVWVEEAASVSQMSIDALIPTIRREGSEIWWSYNPRYRTDPVDVMFRGSPTLPPGTVLQVVGWQDNPWFPEVLRRDMEFDRQRDPEKYAHIWQGRYLERSATRVFDKWSIHPFEAPGDAVLRFGADWGYAADPSVLVRCFIGRWEGETSASKVIADQNGNCLFVDWEAYMVGCPIDDLPALFAGSDARHPERWENTKSHPGVPDALRYMITADSARADTIQYMVKRGFQMRGAIKGPGSVEDGIEFLKSYDIVVHPRCRHLSDELLMYSWAVDRLTGDILPKLADRDNHVIDSLRYALEAARKALSNDFTYASSGPRVFGRPNGYQLGSGQWSASPPLGKRTRL
ncbi:MAG: PBSX family phage terminase large subunit [Pseudomonadota bacterium]